MVLQVLGQAAKLAKTVETASRVSTTLTTAAKGLQVAGQGLKIASNAGNVIASTVQASKAVLANPQVTTTEVPAAKPLVIASASKPLVASEAVAKNVKSEDAAKTPTTETVSDVVVPQNPAKPEEA